MKATLRRLMLAGMLVPAVVRAQTTGLTRATLRLYEQPTGFVLGEEKRIYTAYFNTLRTRSIGVAVTLEYGPAPAASKLSIGCQMTRPDGRVIQGLWKIGMTIAAGSTRAVGANTMFAAGRDGWQTGIHKVTCAATSSLGEVSFQMSPGPSLLGDLEFRLTDVRLFPYGSKLTPPAERDYQDRFISSQTTRIGIELSFAHPGGRSGEVPVDCYFLATNGHVLGIMNSVYEFEPPATSGSVAMGLGYDQPGRWSRGDYLAICQIHGRPISVEHFSVW